MREVYKSFILISGVEIWSEVRFIGEENDVCDLDSIVLINPCMVINTVQGSMLKPMLYYHESDEVEVLDIKNKIFFEGDLDAEARNMYQGQVEMTRAKKVGLELASGENTHHLVPK